MTYSSLQENSTAASVGETLVADMQHRRRKVFHRSLSIISFDGKDWLIGVQVASLLQRKTFNMYRCMKKKRIEVRRATAGQVDFLNKVGAVRSGTHSVTFIPHDEALCFVADARLRHIKLPNEEPKKIGGKRRKSYVSMHPRLHRRKPLPWDVQRSIKRSLLLAAAEDENQPSEANHQVDSLGGVIDITNISVPSSPAVDSSFPSSPVMLSSTAIEISNARDSSNSAAILDSSDASKPFSLTASMDASIILANAASESQSPTNELRLQQLRQQKEMNAVFDSMKPKLLPTHTVVFSSVPGPRPSLPAVTPGPTSKQFYSIVAGSNPVTAATVVGTPFVISAPIHFASPFSFISAQPNKGFV